MAEGDTILRAAKQLRLLEGSMIAVETPNPRGRAARVGAVDGLVLEGIDTHGKNLLFRFDDLTLHSHLGMSGSWHVYRVGERWRKPRRQAWAVLRGDEHEAVQFGGPTLRVLRTKRVAIDPKLAGLGPDILDAAFTPAIGAAALRETDPARGLGDALLDQGLIAGIGNIFKSEGCWSARVDPWRRMSEVSDEELLLVVDHTQRLMVAAVADGRQPKRIHRRAGFACPRCRRRLLSRGQGDANRTTYWCAHCQV